MQHQHLPTEIAAGNYPECASYSQSDEPASKYLPPSCATETSTCYDDSMSTAKINSSSLLVLQPSSEPISNSLGRHTSPSQSSYASSQPQRPNDFDQAKCAIITCDADFSPPTDSSCPNQLNEASTSSPSSFSSPASDSQLTDIASMLKALHSAVAAAHSCRDGVSTSTPLSPSGIIVNASAPPSVERNSDVTHFHRTNSSVMGSGSGGATNSSSGQRFPRSSSLKTTRTPPGTPNSKGVRFANAFGFDLTTIKHIFNQENPPSLPESATKYLKLKISGGSRAGADSQIHPSYSTPVLRDAEKMFYTKRIFQPCFPQPGCNANFIRRVMDSKVCLESAHIDNTRQHLHGQIRVANLAYFKRVTVRLSQDNWASFQDVATEWRGDSDGFGSSTHTDAFHFSHPVPDGLCVDDRLQFAIRFQCGDQPAMQTEFWDNNFGKNYVFMMMELIKEAGCV